MTERELLEFLKEAEIPFEFTTKKNAICGLDWAVKIELSDLADLINDYFLPRPLFEDGTPVKVGDRFLLCGRNSMKVTVFYVIDNGSFSINGFQYNKHQRVMKPEEKPDSWEQIEADEKKDSVEYWGCEDDDEKICCECEHGLVKTRSSCTTNKYIDLLRRAKALAGFDDE